MPTKQPIIKQFLLTLAIVLLLPSLGGGKPSKLSKVHFVIQQDDDVYAYVDVAPQFPGGQRAMSKFISKNLRYPQKAIERNQQGIVKLYFVVRKDGSVDNIKVIKSAGSLLDKEAIRILKSMPRWKPGYRHGKPVNAQHSLPISFSLVYS